VLTTKSLGRRRKESLKNVSCFREPLEVIDSVRAVHTGADTREREGGGTNAHSISLEALTTVNWACWGRKRRANSEKDLTIMVRTARN